MADAAAKLLELAILQHDPDCRWRLLIDRMNQLGAAGCRKHKAELLERMKEFYGDRSDLGDILEKSCKRTELFEKALRQQQGYADAFEDFGHRSALHQFKLEWQRTFREPCPADELERFAKRRLEIYQQAGKCGRCGCRVHWLEDDTREALSTCKTSAG
jgi:hypothetical protein